MVKQLFIVRNMLNLRTILPIKTIATWLSSLDNFEIILDVIPQIINLNQSCIAAGFNFTGTKCCGEIPNEYYNDSWSVTTLSDSHGICWNSNFIPDGTIFNDDKYIAYNGSSYHCDSGFCQNYLSNVDEEDNLLFARSRLG